jgi:hypothetical protein
MVHLLSLEYWSPPCSKGTTCSGAQSKGFPAKVTISTRVDDFVQHPCAISRHNRAVPGPSFLEKTGKAGCDLCRERPARRKMDKIVSAALARLG